MNPEQLKLLTNLQNIINLLPPDLQQPSVLALIRLALAEDLSPKDDFSSIVDDITAGDVTSSATIPAEMCLMGYIRAKASGVVAGLPLARVVFSVLDAGVYCTMLARDGDVVQPGMMLAEISASGRALLAGERTALNFLGRMSGIASLTRQFVDAVRGTHAVILDTRKTAPGWRYLDKYAVRMGGGQNHRTGLFDMVLIKDNHIAAAGGITAAVAAAREKFNARYEIEVEIKNLEELEEALSLQVNRIMLDNMDLETMRIAVQRTGGRMPLEASGNVSLENVRQIAETGVDYISSGSLTHSAPVLDISMKIG